MTTPTPPVSIWQEHIRVLAEDIGPRGSTTDGERRATEYCRDVLSRLGYVPQIEYFTSASSSYQIHLMVGLLVVLAFTVYRLGGQAGAIAGALITLFAVYSESRELLFKDNLLRRFITKGPSQNVWATLPPAEDHLRDLVIIGHVDTHRTTFIFRSTRRTDAWRVFGPIAYFSFVLQILLYILGAATGMAWIWPVSAFSAVCGLVMAVICFQGDLTPFSPGANDNATGAGLVLTLAETLRANPLKNTRVWLVCTGCEEVKHYGAIDFFDRHASELKNPAALVFEMLGRDGPAWVHREAIVPPFSYYSDPSLMALAKDVAVKHPEFGGHPTIVSGGHTEMADALRVGIPAIAFVGVGPDGIPLGYNGPELYWHRPDDTPDKIDVDVLERTYGFTRAFVGKVDEQ